ncbi:rolling circle replication-associated protein [Anaerotignum sp. MB30-C6]|uniref:rolling circle replication-associated protein n=1 Tax=Anaerotignum sp. MB30-C6 TaxID=3070814 RepID=UPI0027DD7B33|nr:hypothetical protein [Anaerotignum sp. MB30-C6]WMI82076.1 hypothetical protein RBQ60_04905 [Anaerotignum sp. MB30-C6]
MPRYRKHIWAGDVYECEEYFSPKAIGKKHNRGQNELLTSEEQKQRNLKIARRKLSRLINTNFKAGDLFVTLTYRERLTLDEIKREFRNFLSCMRRWRKKKGLSAIKYIVVTEREDKREHHHLLINAMDITLKELSKLWGLGRVMISQLEPGGDYTGLARYITKENVKEYEKRWSTSKNLKPPKVIVKKLKSVKPKKRSQAPKGYVVVESSEYFSEDIGVIRYLKAIRIGGEDYGAGKEKNEL